MADRGEWTAVTEFLWTLSWTHRSCVVGHEGGLGFGIALLLATRVCWRLIMGARN